jgi:predicted dehydrogenase/threonine dehydrogenase-like Zn-dependent dehydrogenase
MKQVLQNRSGLTVVRDVPAPQCGRGSVLVRNAFSTISAGTERSRVALSQKSLLEKARDRPDLVREVVERARHEGVRSTRDAVQRRLSQETPVGYSSAGTVIELGVGVSALSPGDRVACAGGGYANHAEIVSVPANLVAKVPDEVPLEVAAMATIAAIPLHALRLTGMALGESVAVIGCGLVGQIACRLAHAAGARVFALDIDPIRVEQARSSGIEEAFVSDSEVAQRIRAATGGVGVDNVLITAASPSSDPLVLAADIACDRGSLVLVGDVPVSFPRAPLYEKELSFRISRSYGPGRYDTDYEEKGLDYPIGYVRWTEKRNMECILDLQSRGRLELADLIEPVPVEQAADAYERLVGPASSRPQRALVLAYDDSPPSQADGLEQRTVAVASRIETRTASAAKSPIRIGLIGPGSFALRVLLPALVAEGAELSVVSGGSGPSAEAAARTFGFVRVAETPAAVIAEESVDAVVIATRHGSHAPLVVEALQAGKHVFTEKPLALTVEELNAVMAAAAESTGILAVGFNRRFAPLLRQLRAFVLSPPAPVAAVYRVSAGRLPPSHWVHDLEQGGGRTLGEVCHFADSLSFITGSPVVEVHSAGYGDPQLAVQARDNVAVTLGFANGSVGSILYVADGSARLPKERLEAFSEGRTAILDDFRTLELLGPEGKDKHGGRRQDKGHRSEIASFLRGIEQREPPVPLTEIANVSLTVLAAVESLRTAQTIRVAAA